MKNILNMLIDNLAFLIIDLLIFAFSLVFYWLSPLLGLHNKQIPSFGFNLLFGSVSLLAILFFLHLFTRSRSLFAIRTLNAWRSYIFMHLFYLLFLEKIILFSVVVNANARDGMELITLIIGTRGLHFLFVALACIPAFDCIFPQEISLRKCRGVLCLILSSIWLYYAIGYLFHGDIILFWGFILILYTTLSIASSRTSE